MEPESSSAGTDLDPSSQPRPAPTVPESFSQPIAQQADRLLTKYRRAVTDSNDRVYQFSLSADPQLPDEEFATVRKGVFKVIEERLEKRNITSVLLTEESISWCLPTS
jgi:hypothetical protein